MAKRRSGWDRLPHEVTVEIFSYLSHEDKINASSTCKHWRACLFYPTFWKSESFNIRNDAKALGKTHFLTSCCATFLRNVSIYVESNDAKCVSAMQRLLVQLKNNKQLKSFILKPSHDHFSKSFLRTKGKYFKEFWFDQEEYAPNVKYCELTKSGSEDQDLWQSNGLFWLVNFFKMLIENSSNLQGIGFGCSIDILHEDLPYFLLRLADKHAHSLERLYVATVPANQTYYEPNFLHRLSPSVFEKFHKLQILSIDYQHVTDAFLQSLCCLSSPQLKELYVHLSQTVLGHPGTSNTKWLQLTQFNPELSLHMSVIYGPYSLMNVHMTVLRSAMPLTHCRFYYCLLIDAECLHRLSEWYSTTLTSLHIMGTRFNFSQLRQIGMERTNPFVMMAWRCRNLKELSILGVRLSARDIIAIVRLRGSRLQLLEIGYDDIPAVSSGRANYYMFCKEVGKTLGREWRPLSTDEVSERVGEEQDKCILRNVYLDQSI